MTDSTPVGLRLIRHQSENPPSFRRVGRPWYEWYSLDQHFGGQVPTELVKGDIEALWDAAVKLLPNIDRWEDGRLFGLPRISVTDEQEWVAVDKGGRPLAITSEQLRAMGDRSRPLLNRAGGRPAVGQAVQVRFPDELLTAVDERAAATQTSRAETIRALVLDGLVMTAEPSHIFRTSTAHTELGQRSGR